MQIQIIKRHIKVTRKLREHIEQRLALVLGRFANRIGIVAVIFGNGALNGSVLEKRCHIEIGLRRKLLVEAADPDIFAAVNRAIEHALRSVARVLEQEVGDNT